MVASGSISKSTKVFVLAAASQEEFGGHEWQRYPMKRVLYMWCDWVYGLMHKTELDNGLYLVRPSHGQIGPDGFGFRVGSKGIVQLLPCRR